MKNRKVIYTALFGKYDEVHNMAVKEGWDYFLFTDLPDTSLPKNTCWNIVKVSELDKVKISKSPHLINRWYKFHPHLLFPEYEYSIYLDANIQILKFDQIELEITRLLNNSNIISIPCHPERECIYEELLVVNKINKDSLYNLSKTLSYLISHDYPVDNGLYENNFIWRKHNDIRIVKLMDSWWDFIQEYSRRDQLSLSYLIWKFNIECPPFFGKGVPLKCRDDIKWNKHIDQRGAIYLFKKNIVTILISLLKFLKLHKLVKGIFNATS